MEQVTICKECEFAERYVPGNSPGGSSITEKCVNKDAPVSDYVQGVRHCAAINNGHCRFFQPYTGVRKS